MTAMLNIPPVPALPADRLSDTQLYGRFQKGFAVEQLVYADSRSEPEPVSRARAFIASHLGQPFCLDEVALHAGVSPHDFGKLFEHHAGLTLTEYVENTRVEQAKRMLSTTRLNVAQVAHALGFQSLSQFNRSFRNMNAESPSKYRARQYSHVCAE